MSLKFRLIGIGVLVLTLGLVMSLGALTQENVLKIGTTDRIDELSPANCYDYWSWHTLQQTTENLVTIKPGTSQIVPSLAESWEVSEDGTVYTFHLRQGVTFWDGEPFNCPAMAYSLNRSLAINGPKGGVGLISMIKGIRCEDLYTLKVILEKPDATFIPRFADPIAPAMAVSPKSTPSGEFAKGRYAGTGPYKFVSWTPMQQTVYEAYENYWQKGLPKTPKVVEVFYADAAALRAAVESHEVDVGFRTFAPDDIVDLSNKDKYPDLNVIKGATSLSVRYIVFTTTFPPFDDYRVRQAIAYAVDRDAIVTKVFAGLNGPLYSMVPNGLWSHIDAFPKRDLAKAKELLTEVNPDYCGGKPLEFTLWYTPSHYGTEEADVAAVLKASLEETGCLKVDVNSLEWGTYIERESSGALGMFLLGWYPDFIDPDNFLSPWLTESPHSLGTFLDQAASDFDKACYAKFVELLEGAKKTTDLDERTSLYEEAQKELANCAVLVPLWSNNSQHLAIAWKDVKGIVLDPSMNFRDWLIYKE